jgi:hypothetical protein
LQQQELAVVTKKMQMQMQQPIVSYGPDSIGSDKRGVEYKRVECTQEGS